MSTISDAVIRQEVTVDIPAADAFALFTGEFDRIKPREHNLLSSPIAETIFEPWAGGRVYDRAEDGTVCRWARVLVFEPPHRFVISWDISPRWQLETDPERCSEVEVRFLPETAVRTRVELEHRNLERHGEGWQQGMSGIAGPNGWPLYLARFVALSGSTPAS